MTTEFILVKHSLLYLYRKVPLYYLTKHGNYALYKPAGITLREMRIKENLVPNRLFIKQKSRIDAIQEVQKGLNEELRNSIKLNKLSRVKNILQNTLAVTLDEPISGSLEGIKSTVNIIVNEYTTNFQVIRSLLDLSVRDYTTVLHSVNVMALTLSFASYVNYESTHRKILGLCALLHDVGKAKINAELLKAPRKLNDQEFKEVQLHTIKGYKILSKCRFHNDNIELTALQHHEKIDGSGYPYGRTNIREFAQIVSLIDCYEALVNDDRLYRKAVRPLEALEIIKSEIVDEGQFSRELFKNFAYSLLQFYDIPSKKHPTFTSNDPTNHLLQ